MSDDDLNIAPAAVASRGQRLTELAAAARMLELVQAHNDIGCLARRRASDHQDGKARLAFILSSGGVQLSRVTPGP